MKGVRKDMQQVQEIITRLAKSGDYGSILVRDIVLEVDYLSQADVDDALASLEEKGAILLDIGGNVIVDR